MLTASVPCEGGALDVQALADVGVLSVLDGLDQESSVLPCRAGDPDLWFAEAPQELERAKQLCVDCPVRAQCLEGALTRHEPWGVWGGEIFERGVVVARKRPRGRPRKSEQAQPATTQPTATQPVHSQPVNTPSATTQRPLVKQDRKQEAAA